jgi:hypothetical protein
MSDVPAAGELAPAASTPSLSLLQRAVAVFVRPAQAWGGLETRTQWWFPLLVTLLVNVVGTILLYDRAMMPMILESFDTQIANGQMSAEQADRAQEFMRSGLGHVLSMGPQVLAWVLITFATALVVWFAVGFLLGGKLGYRLSLEVAAWSGLITVPASLISFGLAWFKESFKGVHVGFGALLPDQDQPTKLMIGAKVLLDAIGPLALWYLAVGIIGAAALSGVARRRVAWAVGSLYLVLWAFVAGLAALFAPGT